MRLDNSNFDNSINIFLSLVGFDSLFSCHATNQSVKRYVLSAQMYKKNKRRDFRIFRHATHKGISTTTGFSSLEDTN
jgi:hypothetical protein